MTATALDRVIRVVVGRPFVEFALLQGPGGAIVTSAGLTPRWAPDPKGEEPDPLPLDLEAGSEDMPDVTLGVGPHHVLHLETLREPTDEELEAIVDLFAPTL